MDEERVGEAVQWLLGRGEKGTLTREQLEAAVKRVRELPEWFEGADPSPRTRA